MKLRGSATPLAMLCAGAVQPAGTHDALVTTVHEAAGIGTRAHSALRYLVETGSFPELGTGDDEVRILARMGAKLWEQLYESFPEPRCEVPLEVVGRHLTLTVHVDVLAFSDETARVLDWKTARKDHDYGPQLRSYCTAVLLNHQLEAADATGTIAWVRDQELENISMDQPAASQWFQELEERVAGWDGIYQAGQHCEWCPRSATCEAARGQLRRNVEAFVVPGAADQLEHMTVDEVAGLLEVARSVERYAKAAQELVRQAVERAGGQLRGDSKMLWLAPLQKRRARLVETLSVLQGGWLDDDAIAAATEVHLSKVEDAIAKAAGKGKGAAAIRKLRDQLDAADAVEHYEQSRLVIRRASTT